MNHQIKKSTLYQKLITRKNEVESIFKIYYDCLETIRLDVLKEEYSMLDRMAQSEQKLKEMTEKLSKFSLVEFYHEEKQIKS